MVRAGRNGRFIDLFREKSIVGIGWDIGPIAENFSRDDVLAEVRRVHPAYTSQAAIVAAGQILRFCREFRLDDRVVSYDPRTRAYACGLIVDACDYQPNDAFEGVHYQRKVKWLHDADRDALTQPARNSLGSLATVFSINAAVSAELWHAVGDQPGVAPPVIARSVADELDIEEAAYEAIKDRIVALDWEQMQELVAGLLRAMGYQTRVSPPGADRGKDITASLDGFGFRGPRIVVEVKHRPGTRIGSQDVRSFLGGRHPREKGLFVSTGGFSKDAYYEAEHAAIPLTLLDIEGLVEAIQRHYDRFDEVAKQLLPLKAVYLPVT